MTFWAVLSTPALALGLAAAIRSLIRLWMILRFLRHVHDSHPDNPQWLVLAGHALRSAQADQAARARLDHHGRAREDQHDRDRVDAHAGAGKDTPTESSART